MIVTPPNRLRRRRGENTENKTLFPPPAIRRVTTKGSLQTLFTFKGLVVNKEIQLEESAVFMDAIGTDTKPAVEQPVIRLLVESFQDARGNS